MSATAQSHSDSVPLPQGERVVPGTPPFDAGRLDALLEAADVDAVVTTSRQAAQYMLGGYSFPFFDHRDAIGLSRYLPVMVYIRGRPDLTAYIAHRLERHEHQLGRFWTPVVQTVSGTTTDAIEHAVTYLRGLDVPLRRVGIEPAYLPSDSAAVLRDGLANSRCSISASRSSVCAPARVRPNLRCCGRPRSGSSGRCWPPSPPARRARRSPGSWPGCGRRRSTAT